MALTTQGFVPKTLADVLEDMDTDAQGLLGFGMEDDPVLRHLLGSVAPSLADAWGQLQALYDQLVPNNASGILLDNLAQIVGVTREGATFTRGGVTFAGVPETLIPIETIIEFGEHVFITLVDITIDEGGGAFAVVRAVEPGASQVVSGASGVLATPIEGIESATSIADFVSGLDSESDESLRARMAAVALASRTAPSMRARLEALPSVQAARVISNRTLTEDALSIAPKAYRAVIWPTPEDMTEDERQEVALTLWEHQPAGIASDGETLETVIDDMGFSQEISFQGATAIEIDVTVTYTPTRTAGVNLEAAVTLGIQEYTLGLSIGDDVLFAHLLRAALDVPGVEDASVTLGLTGQPQAATNIAITRTQIARLADGGLTVQET